LANAAVPEGSYELYLCEKPSQGRDIANFLGARQRKDGYLLGRGQVVTWCIGHLLELIPPDGYDKRYKRWSLTDLPIIPQQWQFEAKSSTRKQLNVLSKLLKKAHRVVIATDADREGEMIAREVLEFLHYSGEIRRLWLSALDQVSIKRAFQAIKASHETEPLYRSGLARSRADWLIGMNLTRAYTLLANDKQVRSVGRVQTPTLALVVKRDREIANFKPEPYYEVIAFFASANIGSELLETRWQPPATITRTSPSGNGLKHCFNKQAAEAVINRCFEQTGKVITAATQRKKQPPPLLYNLSSLQQEASRKWGFGAQEVLNLAQALYETHKLTSYPRTDCEYLPQSQFSDVPNILKCLCTNDPSLCELIAQANPARKSRVWNDKKITAHHAIIPTQATPGIHQLTKKELDVYNLIRRRYLAQFFPDYEYDQSTILISVRTEPDYDDQFKASGRISRVPGWKRVIETSAQNKPHQTADTEEERELPAVKEAEKLLCSELKLTEKMTKPPRHYTEGTLIKTMESIGTQVTDKVLKKILRDTAGLGTQATRANIIQTLLQRKFIKKEKKLIKATELGFSLIDTLPQAIKDPALTAQWEQQLDDLASNKVQDIQNFLQQQVDLLTSIIYSINAPQPHQHKKASGYVPGSPCPECGHPLEMRKAVRGKRIGQDYIGCSHYPDCRFYSWN
jgi:DNA topoisomerase-3